MNNELISKYIPLINNIKEKYNYDSNITHLLYLIIPSFITKYKNKEKIIKDLFINIQIIPTNIQDINTLAYYQSIPYYYKENIKTKKQIIINNYKNISLVTLLDNLVHELNHAINSYINEISIDNNQISIRTGLTHINYTKNLTPINKEDSYILEEIINTYQSEQIINIIKKSTSINIEGLDNTIYALNNETDNNYTSDAYYLETRLLSPLLNNNTFIYTLENLRINGNIEDIESWFNNIAGNNSYQKLIKKLKELTIIQQKLVKSTYLKKYYLNKLKSISNDISYQTQVFNNNTNYHQSF